MGNCYKWDLVEYSCILTISGAWGTVTNGIWWLLQLYTDNQWSMGNCYKWDLVVVTVVYWQSVEHGELLQMGSGGVQLYTDNQWSMGNCYKWDLVVVTVVYWQSVEHGELLQMGSGGCYSCILTISGAWGTVTNGIWWLLQLYTDNQWSMGNCYKWDLVVVTVVYWQSVEHGELLQMGSGGCYSCILTISGAWGTVTNGIWWLLQLYTDNQWSMGNCYKWDLVEYSCILTISGAWGTVTNGIWWLLQLYTDNQWSMGNCYKWDLVVVTVVYKLHRTSFSFLNSFHIDLRNILQNINNYWQFLFYTRRSSLNSRRSANRGAGTEFLCAHPQFKHCDHYRLQLQFVD